MFFGIALLGSRQRSAVPIVDVKNCECPTLVDISWQRPHRAQPKSRGPIQRLDGDPYMKHSMLVLPVVLLAAQLAFAQQPPAGPPPRGGPGIERLVSPTRAR